MRRINSAADALNRGVADLDTGGGVVAEVPLKSSVEPDTGWRAIPCLEAGATGSILLRRVGDEVRLRLNGITLAAGSYAVYVASLPAGFVPADEEYFHAAVSTNVANWSRFGIYGSGRTLLAWIQTAEDGTVRPSSPMRGSWRYYTDQAFPAEPYPGTAA